MKELSQMKQYPKKILLLVILSIPLPLPSQLETEIRNLFEPLLIKLSSPIRQFYQTSHSNPEQKISIPKECLVVQEPIRHLTDLYYAFNMIRAHANNTTHSEETLPHAWSTLFEPALKPFPITRATVFSDISSHTWLNKLISCPNKQCFESTLSDLLAKTSKSLTKEIEPLVSNPLQIPSPQEADLLAEAKIQLPYFFLTLTTASEYYQRHQYAACKGIIATNKPLIELFSPGTSHLLEEEVFDVQKSSLKTPSHVPLFFAFLIWSIALTHQINQLPSRLPLTKRFHQICCDFFTNNWKTYKALRTTTLLLCITFCHTAMQQNSKHISSSNKFLNTINRARSCYIRFEGPSF